MCVLSKNDSAPSIHAVGFEGIGTKTKAIVPIFVAGEFTGIVGFDNTKQRRAIDSAELAALETAAGVIGAALHRERLVDDVRRERERAAEERVAELAKANAVIRGNLERLASEPDLHSFMGHMLLEATRQFDAASGSVIVSKDTLQEWRIVAHVRDGQLEHAALRDECAVRRLAVHRNLRPQPGAALLQYRAWQLGHLARRARVPPP